MTATFAPETPPEAEAPTPPADDSAGAGGKRRPPWLNGRLVGPLPLVGLCVVVAHLPYLIGLFDPNPIVQQSGLGLDVHRGLLPGRNTSDPNAGFTSQALAHRAVLDWLHGHLPWWNPFEGLGSPLAGELQCAAFFPLIILLAFSNGQMYLYLILCLLAAYSTYFLLARLSLNRWACFAGAVAFGLNGTFAWFRYAPSNPVAFLPLILLTVEIARDRVIQGRRVPWWALGAAVGLSIVAGFPETAYLDGLLAGLWAVVRLGGLPRGAARRYLGSLAAGGAMGLALAAPMLVAFADYLPSASLADNSVDVSQVHITSHGLATLLFPYSLGPLWGRWGGSGAATSGHIWARTGGYLTVAVVALAVIGLIGREYRGLKLALAGWALVLVSRSYGVRVVSDALGALPGMDHVIAYRFMNPSLSMAVVVLAAFGVRDVLEARLSRRLLLAATAVVAMVAVVVAVEAMGLDGRIKGGLTPWEGVSLAWGLATILLIGTVVGLARIRRWGVVALVALLPVEAIGMFVVPELSAPTGGRLDMPLVAFLKGHIGLDRFATLGPFLPNYGSYFGIASLNENDLPLSKDLSHLIKARLDPNANPVLFTGSTSLDPDGLTPVQAFDDAAPTYEALGVKYLLAPVDAPPPAPPGAPLTLVYADSLAAVYQLPDVAPFYEDRTPGCTVSAVSEGQAIVDCPRPSTLVRNELEMPGWTARVNGRAAVIGSSRLYLETVDLPAGRDTVTFVYRPAHEAPALAAMGLAVVAYPAWAMVRRRRGSRPGGPAGRRAGPEAS